ncbi:MAG: hypothetical protein CSB24_04650 [Deltaproteobacteria bacterium]|nr:MAG: hypothetical protein CSB24_04650 [Deltaproteobacteria bacterium]
MIVDDSLQILGKPLVEDKHYQISGTVKEDGQFVSRPVIALDRYSMAYRGGTVSDAATGVWKITGLPELPEKSLLVLSIDLDRETNAEVFDSVTPCLME